MTSVSAQMDTLCRGIVDLHQKSELEARLGEGRPLRVKAGFDPTRPDLHLGHTVLMEKMRQFQELGHTVVFVIGDFTAMLGDPTGRNELRPKLSRQEVRSAAETYQAQAFKILDRRTTEIRYNSEWLDKLTPYEIVELTGRYTVARMLERDDFRKRHAGNVAIHIHEFLYPLLQAYDSVKLACDIELGGTDQLFNLLVGRDIMPRYGLRAQMVMTTPLLEGTDARLVDGKIVGAKMSKSAGNYVGIDEPPFDMLQKLMLVDDQVVWRYLELLSPRPTEELRAERAQVERGELGLLDVKTAFAGSLVTRYHGAEAAEAALARRRSIAKGDVPEDVPEIAVPLEGAEIRLSKALAVAGLAKSGAEAGRLIKQGGVQLDGARVEDELRSLAAGRYLVRVGGKNRRFAWLAVGAGRSGG
ncbi:MAG: tyrosine--tRNA ligase [Myxococcales bacterium]|nr:tyrosine--tRNA ligase [Myxococcales bacterium]